MAARKKPRPPHTVSDVLTEERTAEAVALRRRNMPYRAIAAKMGVSHVSVWKRVQAALKETREQRAQDAEEVLELELERLDDMQEKLWPALESKDPDVIGRAVRELRRTSESRRRLLGLDAPKKLEVKGRIDNFAGWTDEELELYANDGTVPERYRERAKG